MSKLDLRFFLIGIPQKEKITIKKVLLITICTFLSVMLNFGGSLLAEKITFPLYLDSIVTIFVAAKFGLIPSILCALGSNLMLTIFLNSIYLFVICHIITAVIASLIFYSASKAEDFSGEYTIHIFLWVALFSAISNGILGNIIVDYALNSVTSRNHIDFVVQGIYSALPNRIIATYFAGIVENLTDKMISACLSFGCYKLVNLIKI